METISPAIAVIKRFLCNFRKGTIISQAVTSPPKTYTFAFAWVRFYGQKFLTRHSTRNPCVGR